MSRLARRVCDDGAGGAVGLEHRLHVAQQPGPVESLQAQRHEVLVVRRTCRRRGRRQQHAPPQLMQSRRARRQLEAGEQLLDRLEVEPAPKLERQARGVGRHDGRQLALLDAAAAGRGPWRRLRVGWACRRLAHRRPRPGGQLLAGAGLALSGPLGVRLEGVPAVLGRGRCARRNRRRSGPARRPTSRRLVGRRAWMFDNRRRLLEGAPASGAP